MFILYYICWIIFNERITGEVLVLGLPIAGLLFWFSCLFLDHSIKKEWRLYCSIPAFLLYLPRLIVEILLATKQTIGFILFHEDIKPAVVKFDSDFATKTGKVLMANSITLTPGTITIQADDGFIVHCLDESLAEGIDDSTLSTMIHNMEGDKQQ